MEPPKDHLGREETPPPPPGRLSSDHYVLSSGYSTYRPSGTKDWLIMYTLNGHGIVIDEDRPLSCTEGDVVVIPPHVPHYYYTAEGSHWEKLWCHFTPRDSWMAWIKLLKKNTPIIRVHIDGEIRNNVRTAFVRLLDYNRSAHNDYREELCLNALEEILLLALTCVTDTHRTLDPRVKEVLQYIAENYAQEIKIEALAKKVCLSPSRLAHLFKEQVGETIVEVLIRHRLKQAEKQLKFTSRPISDIAYDVGFNSPDYFNRKFKEYYWISPSLYRKQARNVAEQPQG